MEVQCGISNTTHLSSRVHLSIMKVHSSVLLFIASFQHVSAQDPGPCSLCIDGSDPPLLDNPVFDFGANESTCADFAAGAAAISMGR